MLSSAAGGGIGDIVLTVITGVIKNMIAKNLPLWARHYVPAI
jgi:hypothetical protein